MANLHKKLNYTTPARKVSKHNLWLGGLAAYKDLDQRRITQKAKRTDG